MEIQTPQPLTPKESKVFIFIESFFETYHTSPTYAEIQKHFGFASINSVQNYVKQLQKKGYLSIPEQNSKRALQILQNTEPPNHNVTSLLERKRLKESSKKQTYNPHPLQVGGVLSLPLLGRVAAGEPIEALDHDEFLDVPPSMVRNPARTFALKVEGQSMIEDGILDGDMILVQEQSHANNGEIVVAIIDGEATVKRIYHHRKTSSGDNEIELKPSNSEMESFWYPASDVEIRGIMIGLIRKF